MINKYPIKEYFVTVTWIYPALTAIDFNINANIPVRCCSFYLVIQALIKII